MIRLITLLLIALMQLTAYAANPLIQVDMILFMHQQDNLPEPDAFIPRRFHGIPLSNQGSGTYHLLPHSVSQLASEYYALSKRSGYQLLGHYSWIQPAQSKAPVLIQLNSPSGWLVNGQISLTQGQYYLLNGQFEFSLADKSQVEMLQQQRLKGNTVYYLDHPQAGMLIKIHPVT